tara:strand:- start:2283 stop:2654 length:372 start_codon:yes stop_codon:yes gene_type:complete
MDILERLFDDTLWIYTAILGSIGGAAFLFWFKDTRMAQWGVAKFDRLLETLAIRWGWTWLQTDPDLWRKKYPKVVAKIDELETRIAFMEEIAHAPVEPGGATELKNLIDDINKRLDKIEKKRK